MWKLLRPLFFLLPAERAHYLSMSVMRAGLQIGAIRRRVRSQLSFEDPILATNLAGVQLATPVGLAAGFDKNGEWFQDLAELGFGFIEMGTITGLEQAGNPKPRLFRLPKDRALLNRMGFNNQGADRAAAHLRGKRSPVPLGINIGKSKLVANEDAAADYLKSFKLLADYADYLVINVSSPNTPGLRELQAREPLMQLLETIQEANVRRAESRGTQPLPIFVKLAPDLHTDAVAEAVDLAVELGLSGIIATNTTNSRADLETPADEVEALGNGGISGGPLTQRSRAFVRDVYRMAGGKLQIIGVGGIMEPEDAWQMIRAGASAVQVYTGFIYAGPSFPREIAAHIAMRLREHDFESVADAVGCGAHED